MTIIRIIFYLSYAKNIFFICLFNLLSPNGNAADHNSVKIIEKKIADENCKYLTNFLVMKNLKNGLYEIQYVSGYDPIVGAMTRNGNVRGFSKNYSPGFLKVHSIVFESTGNFSSILYVKKQSEKEMELENGFTKKIPYWEESDVCKKLFDESLKLHNQVQESERKKEIEIRERNEREEKKKEEELQRIKNVKEKKYREQLNKKQEKIKELYEF